MLPTTVSGRRVGVIVVGIHVPTRECRGLEQLQALLGTPAGRATLAQTHLRLYTSADYLQRWNECFRWAAVPAVPAADTSSDLTAEMGRKGLTRAALARSIGVDRSFVGKLLAGNRPWPAELRRKAEAWVAACAQGGASGARRTCQGDSPRRRVGPRRGS
jgi:hypothetical protein